jgi:hypothetical protein
MLNRLQPQPETIKHKPRFLSRHQALIYAGIRHVKLFADGQQAERAEL